MKIRLLEARGSPRKSDCVKEYRYTAFRNTSTLQVARTHVSSSMLLGYSVVKLNIGNISAFQEC